MRSSRSLVGIVCLGVFFLSTAAAAQDAPTSAAQSDEAPDDAVLRLAEPDFRLVNVPTTLVLPRNRAAFELVGGVTPRVGGFESGEPECAFGIEKRAGGHLFQLNFANTVSTTYRHLARGGFSKALFLGFNIARKFY